MPNDKHNEKVKRPFDRIARHPAISEIEISEMKLPSPEPEYAFSELFEDALIDAGLPYHMAARAAREYEVFLEREVYRRAGSALRNILFELTDTKLGKQPELVAILVILTPGRSVSDLAKEHKFSEQRVAYHIPKMRKILGLIAIDESNDAVDKS